MAHFSHPVPSNVTIPRDVPITPPAYDLPEDIKRFFGKTGMWWGTWRSPQTRDGFDTILIIAGIHDESRVEIHYVVPDYPPWYVTAAQRQTLGRFSRKPNGRLSLLFRYEPFGYTMESWFEGRILKGAVHRRFMSAYIDLKPLLV